MVKKLSIVLVALTFIACRSKTDKNKANTDSSKLNLQTIALIKKFKPILQGVWVKTDYVIDLERTRSPYGSRSKLKGIACMDIEQENFKGDSIVTWVSLNNHEGTQFSIYFSPGSQPNSIKISWPDYDHETNFYELGYINKGDTKLVLYHYLKDKHLLDSTVYSKVLNSQKSNDAGYGIQYIANKKLMSGRYLAIDLSSSSQAVDFDDNGNISGLSDFKTYHIGTDFEVLLKNNLDQVYFDIDTKKQRSFSFKLVADTLNLYETSENSDSTKLVLGKLKYRLVKQK